jgi:hypothetical protein
MSEITKSSNAPADRARDLVAFDFEPILEFLSPEGIEGAYQSLDDLSFNSKIAFAILRKSKSELIDASRNMLTGRDNGAPALILKQRLDEAQILAQLLLRLIEEAKRRTLSSIANCYQADRTLREIVLKIADTKSSSSGSMLRHRL